MNIYSWVKENATSSPKKICIRYKDQSISFAELYKLTDALASSLSAAGISRGDNVTMVLPNMPEFVISYMAIVSLGAVAVPINPSFTSRELQHVLSDSESKGIVIENKNLVTYTDIKDDVPLDIVLTTGEGGNFSSWTGHQGRSIIEDMDPDDPAVMIYSSGLTGFPMGAMLTHANLEHQSDLLHLCMDADQNDMTLTLIPCFHSFSASVNMLSMMRYGGSTYLMKKLDFKELHNVLKTEGITAICAVPTLFYGLIFHPDLEDIDYSSIHTLIAGGSALSIDIYNTFKEKFHADIRQGYGITEASPVCSVNRKHRPIKPESIGQCVPGVEVKIVDDNGSTLKPDEHGEIIFKGPNIMKGYYKKEKETSEILRDGWLYTGDLGYIDDQGYIYITGYKKDMVITSGFNVYSKEVTGVLNSLPGIKDSAITGEPDLMRGSIIKAYLVRDNDHITEKDVKRFARKNLASYKTPRKIVFVPEIPKDSSGRVMKDLLKDPET